MKERHTQKADQNESMMSHLKWEIPLKNVLLGNIRFKHSLRIQMIS